MATTKAGILNSQKTPEPITPDLKIYGVDGLPTKSEHMPNLNVVRTDDAVGMTPADFHNVFPFNEIINENVPTFVEYGRWDEKYNTFEDESHMVYDLSKEDEVFYEHLFDVGIGAKTANQFYGTATHCKIYVKDPNNRYKYVIASGTRSGRPIDFENCVYEMENMDAYLQEIMEGKDTSYAYPVVRYGFNFLLAPSTAVSGYIYYALGSWYRNNVSMTYLQIVNNALPKQEITTSSIFKTLDNNKYWRYNGGTSYTIADFDEIPIPLTPTKRIPKFYVKRGMNADGTWYEKISKTKHDETWLCHKAFISPDDGLEKPYIYIASEIVTSTYRDLRKDRGNFKVYGETEYDMFETLFRIAYASWMSTYSEEDNDGNTLVIADLKEFGIDYLDCVLRVDTRVDEGITTFEGVGFGCPWVTHNGMSMYVSEISTFKNVKGDTQGGALRVPNDAPVDGAMYHFNEIEINGNDIFKYVDIISEYADPNPVIRQSRNANLGPDNFGANNYQTLSNDIDLEEFLGSPVTLRDIEYYMRSGNFWQILYSLTGYEPFTLKQDEFNPSLMELYTYTKTNNSWWTPGYDGNDKQPNAVGIGTGMLSFLDYLVSLAYTLDFIGPKAFLPMKFLSSQYYEYDVLLYPVKTRLVMLP